LVYLRKPNGKLAVIELSGLSQVDQQYVSKVQRLRAASERTHRQANALPEFLVWVQVSQEFLAEYTTRDVEWQSAVSDNILGTTLVGSANTQGTTRIDLKSSSPGAAAELSFAGIVESRTTGYNGPIVSHNGARTRIEGRKPLRLDAEGLKTSPGKYFASTSSSTYDVATCLPRLRGRIAMRIGWREAEARRPRVNEIASQHAIQQLDRAIDVRLTRAAATLHTLMDNISLLKHIFSDDSLPTLRFASTTKNLHIVLHRAGSRRTAPELKPPPVAGSPSIAARVHRSVIQRALSDPTIRHRMKPLIALLRHAEKRPLASFDSVNARLSNDGQWLLVDYTASGSPIQNSRNGR
jgi:hypothetical protein